MKLTSQALEVNALLSGAEPLKLFQPFFQERTATRGIQALVVMESGGDLDQAVEENLFVALRLEPHGFERLMGIEESLGVEQVYALSNAWVHVYRARPSVVYQDTI